MSLQVEKLEKNMAKLTVEVPAEQFEKALTTAFNKNKSRFNIPGFRKGKAPQAMVEQMYGVEVLYEDCLLYTSSRPEPIRAVSYWRQKNAEILTETVSGPTL